MLVPKFPFSFTLRSHKYCAELEEVMQSPICATTDPNQSLDPPLPSLWGPTLMGGMCSTPEQRQQFLIKSLGPRFSEKSAKFPLNQRKMSTQHVFRSGPQASASTRRV